MSSDSHPAMRNVMAEENSHHEDAAERLRAQAEHCLRLANSTQDQRIARELRKLAEECLRAATDQPTIH